MKEGAQRFTTARVAEEAGVSVGSLYQYFPNKAAILFRLQSDEWRQTTDLLRVILEDVQRSPVERLRTLVHAFIRSECDEAEIRVALKLQTLNKIKAFSRRYRGEQNKIVAGRRSGTQTSGGQRN